MRTLEITFPIQGYAVGEVAGFEDDVAARLVRNHVAVPYVRESPSGPGDFHRVESTAAIKAPPVHTAIMGEEQAVQKSFRHVPSKAKGSAPKDK